MRDDLIEWFALTALMMNPMPTLAVSVIERTFGDIIKDRPNSSTTRGLSTNQLA
jgi:hypothetical protein